MNEHAQSTKDQFFEQLAAISNAMIEAHGRDFAIGTLVLAARYIAENAQAGEAAAAGKPAAAAQAQPASV